MSFDEARARKQLEQVMASNGVRSRKLAADIAASVARQDRSKPLAEILDKAFQDVDASTRMRNIVAPAVVQSVAAGYGVLPSVSWEPSKALQERAASLRWEGSDMPTLSDRIHGSAQGYRRELEDSLRTSFRHAATVEQTARAIYDGYQPGFAKRGPFAQITPAPGAPRPKLPQAVTDAVDAASVLSPDDKIRLKKYADRVRAYTEQLKDGPLRTSYLELARALESSRAKGLDRAIRVATEEKARYYANRIARTEATRAWGGAFRDRIDKDPRVVGIRSRLSSAHKVFDICDFHATADLYKMGPGVYPKDRAPAYPYHAHCTCLLSPVYRQRPSETPPRPGGPDMDAGARALRGMTDAERKKLLTIPGAKQFQGDPGSWSRNLRQWGDSPKANAAASAAASQLRRGIELETMSMDERAEQEERLIWKNAGFETGVIIRDKLESIRIRGEAASVSIPLEVVPKLKGATFTHNHPLGWGHTKGTSERDGNSFSVNDLRLGSFGRCATIRAVTPRYIYRLDYNGNHHTLNEVTSAHREAWIEVWERPNRPESGNVWHEVNLIVAKRFGWTYSRRDHGFEDGD